MVNLKPYLPHIYKDIVETDEIIRIEELLFSDLDTMTTKIQNNQFVLSSDVDGVIQFENMLNIIPNPLIEDLQFRIDRIINRLSMTPPFSYRFLKKKLDEIIGVGQWQAYIDYSNYTLYVESSASNQRWFHEILVTINGIKPANIVFINKPYTKCAVHVSEGISLGQTIFNYRVGTTWILGLKPFSSTELGEVIKLPSVPSIEQGLLNNIAILTAGDVAKVRVNGNTIITEFEIKNAINDEAIIEYRVVSNAGITAIDKLELLDEQDEILTISRVYIPVIDDVVVKHLIKIKEGI